MNNLLPILIGLGSLGAIFWPQLKSKFTSDPDKPPHDAMNTVIQYFSRKNHKAALESAIITGHFIYDVANAEAIQKAGA